MNHTPTKEAAFMGKVTAGLTHELKNIFAIIKESAGLMEDLLAMSTDEHLTHQDRFVRSLARVGEQVARGVDLAVRLNRFAHAPDKAVAEVDLNELADHAAFLAHRLARTMGVTLEIVAGDKPPVVVTNPFRAQMMLFEGIDLLVHLEGRGTHIAIRPAESNEGTVSLELAYEAGAGNGQASSDPVSSPRWPELREIAQSLKATIEPSPSPLGLIIRFCREGGSPPA